VAAAEVVGQAAPAQANNGNAVLQGADNGYPTHRTAVFTPNNSEIGILADPNSSGKGSLGVYGLGQNIGVLGEGSGDGAGLVGTGSGSGRGLDAQGGSNDGWGVLGTGGYGYGVAGQGGPSGGVGRPGQRGRRRDVGHRR
jgi:hypothetical protein